MTPEEAKAFQSLFQDAAATLPERVLRGRQLVWKPTGLAAMKEKIKAARLAAEDEIARAKPVTPSTGWISAKPTGRPQGPLIGQHRAQGTMLADIKTASKKAGAHADAIALLTEGAKSGYELATLAPGEANASLAPGFYPDVSPDQELAIKGFANIIRSSGITDPAIVGSVEGFAGEIVGCLPILGAATNLGSAVINCYKLADRHWNLKKIDKHAVHITPGNPSAALQSVRELHERKRNEFATIAALDASAGALQLTGLFADLGAASGPGIGIAKAALKLAHSVALAARGCYEFRKANQVLLAGGPFTSELVGKCPILGCYLITEAEHSTLLAFLSAGELPPNWMDMVETRKHELETLIRLANICQREAPFALRGLEHKVGSPVLKGEHYLDFRAHKGVQRAVHEANMILKRDPRGMKFFAKHLLKKIGL